MNALTGGLFASDFLKNSIVGIDEWQALADAEVDAVEHALRDVFDRFPIARNPNESQTENDLIWPVLTSRRMRDVRAPASPDRRPNKAP